MEVSQLKKAEAFQFYNKVEYFAKENDSTVNL